MKVLYFHQHFSTPDGSTGTRSYEFSRRLIKNGHSVTVVCGNYWLADTGLSGKFKKGLRQGYVNDIFVIEFKLDYSNSDSFIKRALTFIAYSWKGIKIAFDKDYDMIFCTSTPLTAGIPGIFGRIFRQTPFVFEVRDLWPELPKAMGVIKNPIILKTMDLLETLSYKYSNACIGLSPGIVDGILKKVPNKNVVLIPNGCDFERIKLIEKKHRENRLIVAFTGAHGIANGLDALLDVAKYLIDKNHLNIEFHLIGDGMCKPSLMKRAKKESLINCHFIKPKQKEELFAYLQREVDIGLMILDNIPEFYFGTSPNKFFDYISLGLPVIINYPGWLSDLIQSEKCGFSIPPDDCKQFAKTLISLSNDKSPLINMSKRSREMAFKYFNRKDLSIDFVKFLESVVF